MKKRKELPPEPDAINVGRGLWLNGGAETAELTGLLNTVAVPVIKGDAEGGRPTTPLTALKQFVAMAKQEPEPAHCPTCRCEKTIVIRMQQGVFENLEHIAVYAIPAPTAVEKALMEAREKKAAKKVDAIMAEIEAATSGKRRPRRKKKRR